LAVCEDTSCSGPHVVLVVEDDAGLRRGLERILQRAGLRVLSYASAESLLAAGGLAGATCLILDIQLPRMNGFELLTRLAQNFKLPPVILITALDGGEARAKAEPAVSVLLTKPFSGRALLQAIRAAIPAL
jgi:DNA-binding response OmpR family regulator